MPLSSSGSGHLSFKEAAGIRLPLGVGYWESKLIVAYQLLISPYPYQLYIIYVYDMDSSWVDARAVNGDGL